MSVVWHDLECGRYVEDLAFWIDLARTLSGPILDIGAGTGRVTVALAREGHTVTALDRDAELLAELDRRANGLSVDTVVADARAFDLGRRYRLCLVPMQTIQLLGGPEQRRAFLACARRQLVPGGRLAVAIAEELDVFEVGPGASGPLPDVCEIEGVVYSSQPTAVRYDGDGFLLERRRETVSVAGRLSTAEDRIHLDRVSADEFEGEAQAAGLSPAGRETIGATSEYVGSVVVMLDR